MFSVHFCSREPLPPQATLALMASVSPLGRMEVLAHKNPSVQISKGQKLYVVGILELCLE